MANILCIGILPLIIQARVYTFNPMMKSVIDELGTSRPSLHVQLGNQTVDHKADTVSFFARFLQFDVNQAVNVGVNTPLLVR